MDRYDSLPRGEETELLMERPMVEVVSSEKISDDEWQVEFKTNAEKVMVALNDWFLGMTEERSITVSNLDFSVENALTLVPVSGDVSGDSVGVVMGARNRGGAGIYAPRFLPKAPNTGRL